MAERKQAKRQTVVKRKGVKRKNAETKASQSSEEQLEELGNADLKNLCAQYELKRSGNRRVLTQRLMDHGVAMADFRQAKEDLVQRKQDSSVQRKVRAQHRAASDLQEYNSFLAGTHPSKAMYDSLQPDRIYAMQCVMSATNDINSPADQRDDWYDRVKNEYRIVFNIYYRISELRECLPYHHQSSEHWQVLKRAILTRMFRCVTRVGDNVYGLSEACESTDDVHAKEPFVGSGTPQLRPWFKRMIESVPHTAGCEASYSSLTLPSAVRQTALQELNRLSALMDQQSSNTLSVLKDGASKFMDFVKHQDMWWQDVPRHKTMDLLSMEENSKSFELSDDVVRALPLINIVKATPYQGHTPNLHPMTSIQFCRAMPSSHFIKMPRHSCGDSVRAHEFVIDARAFPILQQELRFFSKGLVLIVWEYLVCNHFYVVKQRPWLPED